jgi:hypothetical protein
MGILGPYRKTRGISSSIRLSSVQEQMRRARSQCHVVEIRDMCTVGNVGRERGRQWYRQSIVEVR